MRVFGTGLCREVFDSKGYLFLKKNELLNKLMTVHDTLGGPWLQVVEPEVIISSLGMSNIFMTFLFLFYLILPFRCEPEVKICDRNRKSFLTCLHYDIH